MIVELEISINYEICSINPPVGRGTNKRRGGTSFDLDYWGFTIWAWRSLTIPNDNIFHRKSPFVSKEILFVKRATFFKAGIQSIMDSLVKGALISCSFK